MKTLGVVAYLCVSVALVSAGEFSAEWNEWKALHGKNYKTEGEELKRYAIWVANNAYIEERNKHSDVHGLTLKMNQFGDMDSEEFHHLYTGRRQSLDVKEKFDAPLHVSTKETVPSSIDYRTKGYVTGVKNQSPCGSCWSFAATGALEGQHFKQTGQLISLSEQNLIDCSRGYGNRGCHGGLEFKAYNYVRDNGIQSEATYPYVGRDMTCKASPSKVVANCTGYHQIPSEDENSLVDAIANIGPISIGFDASERDFKFYSSGVYRSNFCDDYHLTHSMLVVGYGTISGLRAYIVKNSWGTGWGDNGYVYVAMGYNMCGIATDATYPTI